MRFFVEPHRDPFMSTLVHTIMILELLIHSLRRILCFRSPILKSVSEMGIMNKEFKQISNWFRENKLPVNASKTTIMCGGGGFHYVCYW